jgi:hypothetical protein
MTELVRGPERDTRTGLVRNLSLRSRNLSRVTNMDVIVLHRIGRPLQASRATPADNVLQHCRLQTSLLYVKRDALLSRLLLGFGSNCARI